MIRWDGGGTGGGQAQTTNMLIQMPGPLEVSDQPSPRVAANGHPERRQGADHPSRLRLKFCRPLRPSEFLPLQRADLVLPKGVLSCEPTLSIGY